MEINNIIKSLSSSYGNNIALLDLLQYLKRALPKKFSSINLIQ
jgi:hypothetical protein